MSNADDFVLFRNLEREIVESFLAKSIQVRIPRSAGADVITSFAGFFEHSIAGVFDIDRLFFAERRRLRKDRIKRAVFFAALLNEIKVLALLVRNPRDPQI